LAQAQTPHPAARATRVETALRCGPHPIGFYRNREVVLKVAATQARVTHGHPAAVASAQAIAVLVHEALLGHSPSTRVPEGVDDPTFGASWESHHREIGLVDGRLPRHLRDVDMSGWETVAAAHAITLSYPSDSVAGITAAAASGHDTDTVASIVGAIVGARVGLAALPISLAAGLAAKEYVRGICEDLVEASLGKMR
jgi:ADP-ribosylglycohydrolase